MGISLRPSPDLKIGQNCDDLGRFHGWFQKSVSHESGVSEHMAAANLSSIFFKSVELPGFLATRTEPLAFASAISTGGADAAVSRTNGIFLSSASALTHASKSIPVSPSTW